MHPSLKLAAVITASAALGSVVFNARPAGAADGDSLADRVTTLEKIVVRDPSRPNTALTDRLEALEKSIKLGGPGEIKTPDDLKAAVLRTSIAQDDLDRRLKAVERGRAVDARDDATERLIRDLRKEVEDQGRDIRELQQKARSSRF